MDQAEPSLVPEDGSLSVFEKLDALEHLLRQCAREVREDLDLLLHPLNVERLDTSASIVSQVHVTWTRDQALYEHNELAFAKVQLFAQAANALAQTLFGTARPGRQQAWNTDGVDFVVKVYRIFNLALNLRLFTEQTINQASGQPVRDPFARLSSHLVPVDRRTTAPQKLTKLIALLRLESDCLARLDRTNTHLIASALLSLQDARRDCHSAQVRWARHFAALNRAEDDPVAQLDQLSNAANAIATELDTAGRHIRVDIQLHEKFAKLAFAASTLSRAVLDVVLDTQYAIGRRTARRYGHSLRDWTMRAVWGANSAAIDGF